MQYFKHLINKFCFKVKSSNLFKFFFGCVFLFFFIPNVYASEMIFGSNGSLKVYNGSTTYLTVSQSTNNLPKLIRISGSSTLNTGVIDLELSPASGNIDVLNNNYRYLIFDVCANLHFHINITNSSCTGSCLTSGSYPDIDLGSSCTADDTTGTRRLVQVDIQKWYLNEVAEMLEASSYMTITNEGSYTDRIVFNQAFLSDEDYTITYKNQQELINKLNSVNTAITNMNSNLNTQTQNIINNNNTNTQNIINNQNTNAQQAHTDATNIKNSVDSIKNQDHIYNNNASDTVPNSSDINSVINQENTLRSDLDLDVSTLDIQLNTDATTWIWGIVNNIRTINGKITLLFTTILSLAIIKMVLNR